MTNAQLEREIKDSRADDSVEATLEAFRKTIYEAVKKGKTVKITNLCVFRPRTRTARNVRLLGNEEMTKLPSMKTVRVSASDLFKKYIR